MQVDTLEDLYPLTPLQQGMLFHALYTPQSTAYFEQFTCRLEGELDREAFGKAWQQVLDRHPALRTSFEWQELEEPVQVVHRGLELPIEYLDWTANSAAEQEKKFEELLVEDQRRGFAADEPPLMRVTLVRRSARGYFLLWSHHHLLLDGWCLSSIFREVFTFYQAFCQGREIDLPRPRPFRDYIAWLQQQDPQRTESYWRRTMADFASPTDLSIVASADEERPVVIQQLDRRLGKAQTQALDALARGAQVTLATLVQGAWGLLLSHYSGKADITYGTTVAGRPPELRGAEEMIGLFINTLPLRLEVSPHLTLREWLGRLQAQSAELKEYEHTPLVEIQGWSDVPAHLPLFESHLTFENYPVDASLGQLEGLDLEMQQPLLVERTHYPLSLLAAPGESLRLMLAWDTSRVEGAAAQRLLSHLTSLLEAFPRHAADPLAQIPLLSAAERSQTLLEWNDTAVLLADRDRPLHALVTEQAARTPQATAVEFEGRTLTYGELTWHAQRLARRLQDRGVGPETRVGIALERSLELVVGLLAVLQAGGAWVPLDPSHPKPRLALLLDDLGQNEGRTLVLSRRAEAMALPEHEADLLFLDDFLEEKVEETAGERRAQDDLGGMASHRSPASSLQAAYVLYTSGSTGKPKGAVNSHRAIVNRLLWMQRQYGLEAGDRVLQKTPISFDVSVWEFFWPLIVGARLVMLPPGGHLDGDQLVDSIRSQGITTLHFVPSMLRLFLAHPDSGQCRQLRRVILSGEGLPADLKQLFFERLGDAKVDLHNLYGPTEAAIDVSFTPCTSRFEGAVEPIGRAIENLRLYVLDRHLRGRPMGLPGEVHIAGVGLARGYFNRPSLTAQTFVPNPFPSEEIGDRLYKTGDLGRLRGDGVIEFLGRLDFQVKIRGVRIELGEIGAILGQHEEVGEHVVVARRDAAGELQLVAYVVPAIGTKPTSDELRSHLGKHLPATMVVNSWVFLAELPRTSSGKLDRKALPDPQVERSVSAAVAPRTPYEEVLTEIWMEVLGLREVSVHDHFFDLGGHSLRAMQVMSRVRRSFSVELPLRSLFEAPTVAGLASAVERAMGSARSLTEEPLEARKRESDSPLSLAQQRLWFFDQLQPGSSFYNLARPLRLYGPLRPEVLEKALEGVVRRHESLRTTVQTQAGAGVQVIAPAPNSGFSLEYLDLSTREDAFDEARTWVTDAARRPFDLAAGPLFRAALLRLGEGDHVLLLVMHHIISDGWSMDVLLGETVALYGAFASEEPSPLPDLPVQYADYAMWQRHWLSGEVLEEQIAWWRERLARAPVAELPTDRPRPPVQDLRGGRRALRLDEDLSAGLRELARQEGATLFMVIASGLFAWLHRLTGQSDLLLGTPVANRGRPEIEGLVGFFVNTLVLRGECSDDPTFEDWLARVREGCLGAYAHQDLPFERLVDEVAPHRDLARSPVFQVMLSLEPEAASPDLEGLTIEALPVDIASEVFDLSFALRESADAIEGWLGYRLDLFDSTTVERFRKSFPQLLAAAVEDPEFFLSELPLLAPGERHQLFVEWGEGEVATWQEASHASLDTLIRQQASERPEAMALVWETETSDVAHLSYGALMAAVSQVAAQLCALGVAPEETVGIHLERGPALPVAILGALTVGATYVPLDPEQPQGRLREMARDAGIRYLLEDGSAAPLQVPEVQQVPLALGEVPASAAEMATPLHSPDLQSTSADRALAVMYTSGSTGRPKGVVVTHRGLVNRLLWARETYPIGASDRVMLHASFGFDISIWETFGALVAGGSTVLARRGGHRDSGYLAGLLERQNITLAHFVPSMLGLLLAEDELPPLPRLRYLLTGGDTVPPTLPDRVLARNGARMHSQYGPTEASINATYQICRTEHGAPSLPIGRALAGVVVRVLDARSEAVGIGVHGEVCLGGVGLARGYHGQPARTAVAFVPDPEGAAGARLYRTGDRARFLTSGELEFLGRIDRQVKVRGVRVELGEVEAVLGAHPEVREAAVVAAGESGAWRLVAFVEASEAAPTVSALRDFLGQRLSDAMVPTAIMLLDELPRNVNGKLDRRALPDPDEALTAQRGESQAGAPENRPRGDRETRMAKLWADLLNVSEVSRHDNFFELGGDSILSIQLVSRARRSGLEITARQIFQNQTVAALAAVAKEPSTAAQQSLESPLGDAPLTPIQYQAFHLGRKRLPRSAQVVTLALRKDLAAAQLELALSKLLEHHDALRGRFEATDGGWRMRVPATGPWEGLRRAELGALDEPAREAALAELEDQLVRHLDPQQGPLLSAAFVDLGAGQHPRLLIAIHHLVVDGVSWRILLEDLETACEALQSGRSVVLPAKTTPWVGWARRLKEFAKSHALEQEVESWRSAAQVQSAALPVDFETGENSTSSTKTQSLVLDEATTRRLLEEASIAYGTSLEDLLLTALTQTLGAWTESTSLRLDLEGHGREELLAGVDLSRTVGWFTTSFPVLLEIPADTAGPGAALRKVKETLRGLPSKGSGYGLLRWMSGDSKLSSELEPSPPVEVGFNYLGRLDRALSSPRFEAIKTGGMGEESRAHLLEIEARVAKGCLQVAFVFSQHRHREGTIRGLMSRFEEHLLALAEHCTTPGVGGWTPSDFPLAKLDDTTLARLSAGVTPQSPRAFEDLYPLSPMQQGLLFHSLFEEGATAYFNQLVGELHGDLDRALLEESWKRVVERHSIFRTDFLWRDLERPLQVVRRQVEMPWIEEDWRDLSASQQGDALEKFLQADRARGFDLGSAPLMRFALLHLEEERWRFVWSHHHLLIDGWSLPLLLQEVFGIYDALVRGVTAELPPLRAYGDYIAWLEGRDEAAEEGFWHRRLGQVDAPTPLGIDHLTAQEGASAESFKAAGRRLSKSLGDDLEALARKHHLTLGTVIQSAWAWLLGRYSYQSSVVFGLVVAGRPPEIDGVETMLGLFINTLPVRVDLPAEQSLESWLQHVQEEQAELLQYEYSPLAEVQRLSSVPRGTPLFESLFAFENYPVDESITARWGGVEVAEVKFRERTNYPLCITALPGANLRLEIDFDEHRLDAVTVGRTLAHLEHVLQEFCGDPTTPLAELSLLDAAERQQLVVTWNATAAEIRQDIPVHRLVAQRTVDSPERVAVVGEGLEWSYVDVWQQARRLATALNRRGIGPETLVGLCMERQPLLAVALLGILEAGAAYLPLDPAYPAVRLRGMVENAGVDWVLTDGRAQVDLGEVCWLELQEELRQSGEGDAGDGPQVEPSSLAYLVYTSGSTGRPKGVLTPHGALVHYALDMVARLGLKETDRVLQFAPLSFDVLAEEVLPTWISGGSVVFADREEMADVTTFSSLLERHEVTWVELPASFWHEWVDHLDRAGERPPACLRQVLLGCDRPSPERLARWRRFGIPLVVVFGLTETTITNTLFHWSDDPDLHLPIGRPVSNTRLYVLDPKGRVLPAGVAGELWVGGVGVGRGYHGSPGLTAERFWPDRFASCEEEAGGRLYRTGDRARWRSDGCLDFLGRLDVQAKIRGFRVEPAEVEEALGGHPQVREAVVMIQQQGLAERRLVAWVVGTSVPTVAELREYLLERLPEYMVPAVFVTLERLPTTPSGKLDRRSLPMPELVSSATYISPRNDVEERLAEVWAEVLGAPKVGIHDNFFELGGDSILSIQIVSRARQAGLRISPQNLFSNPTVAGLATVATALEAGGPSAQAVVGEIPLSPIQHWFFARPRKRPEHFNMSLMLATKQPLEADLLASALDLLAAHHDALRLRFIPPTEEGEVWRQRCEATAQVPVESFDLTQLEEPQRGTELEELASRLQSRLHLTGGPLLRAAVIHLGSSAGDRLLLVAHHLIVDGVSWRILVEDLEQAYESLKSGKTAELPPTTTAFGAWSQALETTAHNEGLSLQEAEFWHRDLWTPYAEVGIPHYEIEALPVDEEGELTAVNTVDSAEQWTVQLDAAATRVLLRQAPRAYRAQVQDLLLAALAVAFRSWTGSPRLLLELEGHGRNEVLHGVELSRTVGWFTALYPVLVEAAETTVETLRRVKERLRGIPEDGLGWGILRWLGDESGARDDLAGRLAALPTPQVLFNYLGQVGQERGARNSRFTLADEARGSEIEPSSLRDHLLEINGVVLGGEEEARLEVTWTFSRALHSPETVRKLAATFLHTLEDLLENCQGLGAAAWAPSDFPLAFLDQDRLGSLVEDLKAPPEDIYPLSPMQEGMLFHVLYEPAAGLYVAQFEYHLEGFLNVDAFRGAWQKLVERHGALRTAFLREGLEEPLQVVLEHVEVPHEVLDWRHLDRRAQEEQIAAWLPQDRHRGFDVERPPLLRWRLIRTADEGHRLLLTLHQMVVDGWSMPILFAELFKLYEALAEGRLPPLEPAPKYGDYIAWLTTRDEGEEDAFWLQTLAGVTEPTPIPTRPRDSKEGQGSISRRLSEALGGRLAQRAREAHLTLNTLVQGSWGLLLGRYASRRNVVFGVVVSGRPAALPGVEQMVGMFLNTLPLVLDLGEQAVVPWLADLQARQVEMQRHAHTPLARIQSLTKIAHGLSLFESILVFQNYPLDAALGRGKQGTGLRAQVKSALEQTNYPLTLVALPGAEGQLELRLMFDQSKVEEITAQRMLMHLELLLTEVVEFPSARPGELSLLSPSERQQVLLEWNQAPALASSPSQALHQRFGEWVERTPDAVAVSCGGEWLTYGHLARCAHRLAHTLVDHGVRAGDLVGLCLERSSDLVVAILAVLEAEAAYVPLDAAQPVQRLATIFQDSDLRVVVTTTGLLSALPPSDDLHLVLLDGGSVIPQGTRLPLLPQSIDGSDRAYVIYTSGSTGRPKGVEVTHGNVLRLFEATEQWFDFDAEDVWTLFHSYAFDFSVWELWGALLYGGRLVVVPYLVSRSPHSFLDLLCRERVTVLNQTPSAFRQLMAAEEEREVKLSLREVVFGGEALDPTSLRPWFTRHGDARPRLANMYGITETTVHVTWRALRAADAVPGSRSMIGVPIPDLQVYVVDRWGSLAPVGVAGELCIGGAGLASGYLGRPGLTASRFVPYGFVHQPLPGQVGGGRLYRSGDLGRYLPTGELEYLGRIDFQVKVRGFRIELGEIESALNISPLVRESAVLMRGTEDAMRLVAWVVPTAESAPSPEALREELLNQLPEYMVPAAFVVLDELPLTVNGKLDRKALPEPEGERRLGADYVAPQSPVEKTICVVLEEVLELDRVGVHDNFFTLGGDSILSLRVLSKARERGVELSLQELFENPTPAQLAATHGDPQEGTNASEEVFRLVGSADRELLPQGLDDAFPLTRLQAGMLFQSSYGTDSSQYHNVLGVRLETSFSEAALRRAIECLVLRHPVLRTSFDLATYSEPLQLVHREAAVPLTVEDLRQLSEGEQEAHLRNWFHAETHRPFDWTQPGLLRFQVHRLAEDAFHFGLTEHHAILDGWSVSLLFGELFATYGASCRGESNQDPTPLPTMAEPVALERQALESEEIRRHWHRLLEGAELSRLPRWPQEAGGSSTALAATDSGAFHYEVPISSVLSDGLKELAREIGVPVKSLLLAAHLRATSVFSGQADVLSGVVSNSRPEDAEGAAMLGLFLNTLPLRLRLRGGTWRELVWHTFEAERELLPLRRYPMSQLLKERGGGALYEVVFNYTHFHVLEALESTEELRVGDISTFAKTEMPFVADFSMEVGSGRIALNLTVDPEVIVGAPLERIGSLYQRILQAMVADCGARYECDSMLDEETRQRLLVGWNDTERDYPRDSTVPEVFAAQAAKAPSALAVQHGEHCLTYGELDRRANRLARHLHALGIQTGDRVALYMDRCPEMVVALLGILKAGGVYVALDPAYPSARLQFLLADTAVKVVLSTTALAPSLPLWSGRLLRLDGADRGDLLKGDATAPTLEITPEHLAYVSYTSGSTGRPKGVEVRHRGVLRLLFGNDFANFGPQRVLLQLSPIAFDASTVELWGALLHGGLCVLLPERMPTVAELGRVVQQQGVNILPLTTSLYNAVIDEAPEILRAVDELLVGGEALSVPHVRKGLDELPGTRFVACYGPTESTTFTACYPVPTDLNPEASSILLGKPIGNTQVYLLDGHLEPVPVAVAGELTIAGDGLARGYLGRPRRTAQAFVPNPFASEPGGRLYRTGDLARWLTDGQLEFGGRVDHQVKIRGFRIEPGEIEAHLRRHEQVREAVVVVREDRPGSKRLVAYLVGTEELDGRQVLGYLGERVPEYMVPSAVQVLDALPLTPTGKLDHRALPDPQSLTLDEKDDEAPRNSLEKTLAELWCQLLGLPRVGIHQDFLELGGDSILAIQVVARARKHGLRLNPGQLFEHPTIARLAQVAATDTQGVGVTPEEGLLEGELPLAPVQSWFFAQGFATPHHFNLALLLRSDGPLESTALEQVTSALLRHHDALRLRFTYTSGGVRQHYAGLEGAERCFTELDLSALSEERFSRAVEAAAAAAQRSLDLTAGPVLRVLLLHAGHGGPSRLLLLLHHLVVDGISWRLVLEDLQTAYTQASRGEEISLPPKTASYRQWSEGLQHYAASEGLRNQAEQWLLEPWSQVKSLPLDLPEGSNREGTTEECVGALDEELTQALLQDAQRPYRTRLQEFLVTALARVLKRHSGGDAVLLELEGHGRQPVAQDLDLSRTVGWFTALYPLLVEVGGGADDLAVDLKATKEKLRRIPDHGIGWGVLHHLLEDTELRQRFATLPQAQVVFNYLGQFDQVLTADSGLVMATESPGTPRGAADERQFVLEVNSLVVGGRLEVRWTYSTSLHHRATIEGVAEDFLAELRAMIEHCKTAEEAYTPTDFPLVEMDQAALDRLLAGTQVEDLYPLTPTQQGMLFHSLYEPETGAYVSQLTCVLEGRLDEEILEAAWRAVERHSVLRTAFVWDDPERMVQRVERSVALPIEFGDWSDLDEGERQERLQQCLDNNRRRGFDVSRAPLVRLSSFRLDGESGERHQLVWCFHHLLLDGWSLAIVLQEFFAAWSAALAGHPLELPERPAYREYIAWLVQQNPEATERFWRRELEGFETPTALPISSAASGERGERAFSLGSERTEAIEALAKRHRVTVNHLFQGTWGLLLGHLGNSSDVVFGITVAGRPADLAGVEEMVGLFINTVPLRLGLDPAVTVASWLGEVKERGVELRRHEFTPLVKVNRWSEVPAGEALFSSLLVFENYPVAQALEEGGGDGPVVHDVRVDSPPDYPLAVRVTPGSDLLIEVLYDAGAVEVRLAERILVLFEKVVDCLLSEDEATVADLQGVLRREDRQLRGAARRRLRGATLKKLGNLRKS